MSASEVVENKADSLLEAEVANMGRGATIQFYRKKFLLFWAA